MILENLPPSAWRAVSVEIARLNSEGWRAANEADKWLRERMRK